MTQSNGIGIVLMEFQQALALHRQGRTDEAARSYELILLAEPTHLDALIHLGALRLSQGRVEAAEALLQRAVTVSPESPQALGNRATALQALGRHEEAVTHYEAALAREPDMLDARFGLATCLQASGRHEAAIACYETILVAEPAHPEANYGLATLLGRLGRVDEAMARYHAALAADPDFAEANYELGKLLGNNNALEEAISCFRHALDVDPEYAEAGIALATALARLDRDDEAMAAFHAVLAVDPEQPEVRSGIGMLLERKQRDADAMEQYAAVLARNPEQVDAMAGMANALKNIGRHDEALGMARRVVALRPNFGPAAGLLGSILAEIGSIDEALAEYRRAIGLAPNRPEFLYHLALLTRNRPGDDVLHGLEAMLPRTASFPPREQCLVHFALAKAYDDVGERERGFAQLQQGNAIKRSITQYDEATTLGALDRISTVFSAELLAARGGAGDPSAAPIFIVGMPRSGTTLVEQTLASHQAVFGAGERLELTQAVGRLNAERLGAPRFPEAVWTMTDETLRRMGREYLAALRLLAPDAALITDKMPGNFLFIGLIRLILPNARIIHTMRDPVDTCLSCYSKLFTGAQSYTYDLAELGHYYRAYRRLMAHWRAILPANIFLEVEYEALVDDHAAQARRIVAHCGLDWDPACLEFYRTSRPVHTASMVQVRQPIYRSSVGRWRPDATQLQPLLEALAEDA